MSGNLIVIKHSDLQDTKPNFEINIIFYGPTKFRIRIYWMNCQATGTGTWDLGPGNRIENRETRIENRETRIEK